MGKLLKWFKPQDFFEWACYWFIAYNVIATWIVVLLE